VGEGENLAPSFWLVLANLIGKNAKIYYAFSHKFDAKAAKLNLRQAAILPKITVNFERQIWVFKTP
jgi:hypothetical protein